MELSGAPKTAAKKASDLGWVVQHSTTTIHVPEVLLAADGKTGQKGEVRTPAHDELWVVVSATHLKGQVGFYASWRDGKFVDARIVDPIGIPVENRADYTTNAAQLRRAKDEPEWAHRTRVAEAEREALRRDYDYNDESDRLVKRHFTKKATVLTDWLNGWLSVVNPAKAPKPKQKKERALEPLTIGEEWIAQ